MFLTQEERKKHGGSCFIELQFCKLPADTEFDQIRRGSGHWQDDSLYVFDTEQSSFYSQYKDILGYGLHNNKAEGYFDTWGITYYAPGQIEAIQERLNEYKPEDHEVLMKWLEEAKQYNGFYVLGV